MYRFDFLKNDQALPQYILFSTHKNLLKGIKFSFYSRKFLILNPSKANSTRNEQQ